MIIHQNIGLAWTNKIKVNNDRLEMFSDDIISILDDMFYNRKNEKLQFRIYSYDELKDLEVELLNEYIPINGGEYYTDKIEFIEHNY